MEELNLIELIKYYLKKLPIIILTAVLFALIGYYQINYVEIPLYHGTTTIILVQKSNDNQNNGVTQSDINLNEKLVSTYSKIIKSRRVLNQVIESLELNISIEKLASKITVSPISDTSIIKISVSYESGTGAAIIANEIARVFENEITKIYNLENVSVIDEAIVEKEPYNINMLKQVIIFTFIGIILSSVIIIVMFYFDTTIKDKKEIEDKLKLVVLGEIPTADKFDKRKVK